MSFRMQRFTLILVPLVIAPAASAASRSAQVARYEAAWGGVRDPPAGHSCGTADFDDVMRPFVAAHETELVDWILRDGGIDRFDLRLRDGECSDLRTNALRAAFVADPERTAKLAYIEAMRRHKSPDFAGLRITTFQTFPCASATRAKSRRIPRRRWLPEGQGAVTMRHACHRLPPRLRPPDA
jgi:hypothetical protein